MDALGKTLDAELSVKVDNRVQDKDRQIAIANTVKQQISIYALMSMGANKFNWIKETQKYLHQIQSFTTLLRHCYSAF